MVLNKIFPRTFVISAIVVFLCSFQIFNFGLAKSNAEIKYSITTEAEKGEDAKIRAVWAGLKAAIKAKDIKRALEYISEEAKETYEYNFNLLKDHLDELSSSLQGDMELDSFYGDSMANYHILGEHEGEKVDTLVRFEKDQNGSWKVRFF
jgi:hypothetical protein